MQLHVDPNRLDDRRHLLGSVDQWRAAVDKAGSSGSFDHFHSQAFEALSGGMSEAFDISKEDPRTIDRYDTSSLMDVSKIGRRWNNHERYRDHVNSLGKLLLLARRLAERGAGFITVTTNFVWDMHADKNNATMAEGMGYVGTPFDHAVSAYIEDIEGTRPAGQNSSSLRDGRTPKINGKGGRDHWGGSAPLMLYGGGLRWGELSVHHRRMVVNLQIMLSQSLIFTQPSWILS